MARWVPQEWHVEKLTMLITSQSVNCKSSEPDGYGTVFPALFLIFVQDLNPINRLSVNLEPPAQGFLYLRNDQLPSDRQ